MPENTLFTYKTEEGSLSLHDPRHPAWFQVSKVSIDRLPTGQSALAAKGHAWANLTQVSSLWNRSALLFYFDCFHNWVSGSREVSGTEVATLRLRAGSGDQYCEIQVDSQGGESSQMVQLPSGLAQSWKSAAEVTTLVSDIERVWRVFLTLPFGPILEASQLLRTPQLGDAWRLNLYRTAGTDSDREYLAWRPIYTAESDFSSFGHLIFLGAA